MKNKYPGTCYVCRKEVKVGEGYFQRNQGAWITKHEGCKFEGGFSKEKLKAN